MPTPGPGALRTMGLGGYVAGDFGWFGDGSGRAPALGVPGGGVPATIGGLPVLLALLGAFLALQRGIGQGLGHVPMDPTVTGPESHGHR